MIADHHNINLAYFKTGFGVKNINVNFNPILNWNKVKFRILSICKTKFNYSLYLYFGMSRHVKYLDV